MPDEVTLLHTLYECFNARDIDGVLVSLHDGVEWTNGMDGGHVRGKNGVREYWTRQWAAVTPRVHPLTFDRRADGRLAVTVRLELFDLSGQPLASQGGLKSHILVHVYTLAGGVVTRFDIEEAAVASGHQPDATTPETLLQRAFDAFNRRDADELLTLVSDDVAWSSDAGTLNKEDLRGFWARQWAKAMTHDTVTDVERVSDREYLVSLDQEVRGPDGSLILSGRFRYGFVVENRLIAALNARDPV